jgi:TRAP transporter TAXI family solute receptor
MRPFRRTLRRSFLVLISFSSLLAIALALAVIAAFMFRFVERGQTLRIAVGPPGSAELRFIEALRPRLQQGPWQRRLQVLPTEGPLASAAAVDGGRADLAVIRSDIAIPKKAGIVFILHKDVVLLAARPGSKLNKVADLEGKRVGIVPGSEANRAVLNTILTHASVSPASVQHIFLQPGDIGSAIEQNLIQGLLVVAPLGESPADEVVSALRRGKSAPELIAIKDAEAIARREPVFEKFDIPAGFFAGRTTLPKEDLTTLSVSYLVVARQSLAESVVTDFTKRFFAIRQELTSETPVAQYIEAPDTTRGGRFPVHPGAAAYYDGDEKSFLDRYGDWIYIGAMVLGGVGSGLATLMSSLRARSRRAALAVIDRLIDIRRKAHEAQDVDTLRSLGDAVDDASDGALHRARESLLDETGLESIRLAIDEARHAIDGRSRELETSVQPAISAIRPLAPPR